MMNQFIFAIVASSLLLGCTARQVKSRDLGPLTQINPPAVMKREQYAATLVSADELSDLNRKAKMPTIALIKGLYQLPHAQVLGAVKFNAVQGLSLSYSSFELSSINTAPFAVMPTSARQAEAIQKTMNRLLDAGIKIVDISMADAIVIMEAEKKMMAQKKVFVPKTILSSGADLLVSIQQGEGVLGPVYVGRVVRTSDGALVAFMTQPDAGPYSMELVVLQLVTDALKRTAAR